MSTENKRVFPGMVVTARMANMPDVEGKPWYTTVRTCGVTAVCPIGPFESAAIAKQKMRDWVDTTNKAIGLSNV